MPEPLSFAMALAYKLEGPQRWVTANDAAPGSPRWPPAYASGSMAVVSGEEEEELRGAQ